MKYLPMMAHLGDKDDLEREDYVFELIFDGARAFCHKSGDEVKFTNRKGEEITGRYPELVEVADQIKADNCVLDGEIVMFDENGRASFSRMQTREQAISEMSIRSKSKTYPATYVAFDVIEHEGKNIMQHPFFERKKILLDIVPQKGHRICNRTYTKDAGELWQKVQQEDMEGLVAKKADSIYETGRRSTNWIKIKNYKTLNAVIVGYMSGARDISALILGLYDDKKLRYIGKVDTSFSMMAMQRLLSKFRKIHAFMPVVNSPDKEQVQWLKPQMVCEVQYLNFDSRGLLRAPSFIAVREEVSPKECTILQQVG